LYSSLAQGIPKLKYLLTILIVLIGFSSAESKSDHYSKACLKTITRDLIDIHGLSKLSDIFSLSYDWDLSSIDGYTWKVSPAGLTSFQNQQWTVAIDGRDIDIDIFGVRSLNRLPVSLNQIDSIQIYSCPIMVNNGLSEGGHIEIFTTGAEKKPTAKFLISSGNESGDPGPYRYTEYATPNIDKIGRDVAATLIIPRGDLAITLDYIENVNYPTDEAMYYRNRYISPVIYPRQKLKAGSIRLRESGFNPLLDLFVGYSNFNDYYYLKPFGREVPARAGLFYGGLCGFLTRTPGFDFKYSINFTRNSLKKRPNALDIDFDWQRSIITPYIETGINIDGVGVRFGSELEFQSVSTTYDLSDNKSTVARIFGTAEYNLTGQSSQQIGLETIINNGNVGFKGLINTVLLSSRNNHIAMVWAYSNRLWSEDNDIMYWTNEGYDFLADNGVPVSLTGDFSRSEKTTFDLNVEHCLNKIITFDLHTYYRHYVRQSAERQIFQYVPDGRYLLAPIEVISAGQGYLIGGSLAVKAKLNSKFSGTIYYRYKAPVGSNNVANNLWENVPQNNMVMEFNFSPVSNFLIASLVKYTDRSIWTDFADAGQQSGGFYESRIKSFITIDMIVKKYFWNRKIRATFVLKNISNGELLYHPIGARFDLSHLILVEFVNSSF
jgi:hypothetical protein